MSTTPTREEVAAECEALANWLAHRIDAISEGRGAPRVPFEQSLSEAADVLRAARRQGLRWLPGPGVEGHLALHA